MFWFLGLLFFELLIYFIIDRIEKINGFLLCKLFIADLIQINEILL